MIIAHPQIKHGPFGQAQHRTPRLQRLNLRVEHIFGPVDVLKLLFQAELGPTQRLQFLLGATVSR